MSVALLLGICMAGFVYYDSGKRDVSMGARAAWTAAVFLLGIIGLIPYFIFGRKKKKEEPVLLEDGAIDVTEDATASGVCIACGAKIPVDSIYCGGKTGRYLSSLWKRDSCRCRILHPLRQKDISDRSRFSEEGSLLFILS